MLTRLVGVFALFWAVSVSATPAMEKADVEAWLDGFMANALRVNKVQGAVVVVVKDGKVLTQNGYGYADAAKRVAVDPENTMFRPGSISKLFTWTAIMQLSEQGKVDLDADINTYLDFRIDGKDGKKITIRHLMTHRAGFEDYGKSGIFSDPASLRPLGPYLQSYTPERIFASGSTPAYSNYGAAVAGYIVQRVSGMPFETYVEQNIFNPLGMARSTFSQPLPKSLEPYMSKGYAEAGADAKPFETLDDVPAGALSSSGGDMGRFMIAHLNAERPQGGKLFKPDTARLMYRTVVKNFPSLNGMALGFYEANTNGHRVLAHGGDLNWFHSDLFLFIDEGVGLYISMNSAGNDKIDIRTDLLQKFADRYMPMAASFGIVEPRLANLHLQQVSGPYIVTRRLESSFARLGNLLGEVSLSAGEKDTLLFNSQKGVKRFKEISPYLWQELDGQELLAVNVKDGKPVSMSLNSAAPTAEFEPVPPSQSAAWMLPAILFSIGVLAITVLWWPIGALTRRYYGVASSINVGQRRLFLIRTLASVCIVSSIAAWVALIVPRMSSGFFETDNTHILVTQAISIVCVLVAAVCALVVGWGLVTLKQTRLQVLGSSVWLLAAVFTIWFYYHFNFLKFSALL
jgi:CubicO group peptidase (beta-lactamase class C family)